MTNWHKCDFMEFSDGVYYCEGIHHKSGDCEWVKITLEDIREMANLVPPPLADLPGDEKGTE